MSMSRILARSEASSSGKKRKTTQSPVRSGKTDYQDVKDSIDLCDDDKEDTGASKLKKAR